MKTIAEHLLPYRAFLTEEQAHIRQKIIQLEKEGCQDEADLLKISLNIYSVFETIAQADEKACADWETFSQRYEPRFSTLVQPWQNRLAAAVHNSDCRTRFIEETKLAAAKKIKAAYFAAKEAVG